MIPSMVNELSEPFRQKIAWIERQKYEDEVVWLLARSKSWSEFAGFFLNLGYPMQAYQCFENAAKVCLFGEGETLDEYLCSRFLAMHGRCRMLVREFPFLRFKYRGSELESDFWEVVKEGEAG